MVVKLVEITTQKRPRGDTVRPAISIPTNVWNEFKSKYVDVSVRNSVVKKLIQKQLDREVVIVNLNII